MKNVGSVTIVPGCGMAVMLFADAKKMVEEIVKAMQGDRSARSAGGETGATR